MTFKLELDQVWVGTKERTQKLPLNSIKVVFPTLVHSFSLEVDPFLRISTSSEYSSYKNIFPRKGIKKIKK